MNDEKLYTQANISSAMTKGFIIGALMGVAFVLAVGAIVFLFL